MTAFVDHPIAPLLKWPGGKRSIASRVAPIIGPIRGRYFEPFAGGAAIFFHLRPRSAVLSDVNPELINCYEQVRRAPKQVGAALRDLPNSVEDYYRIREWEPTGKVERCARLIYLTTLSFNGIYRQNLDGRFNVPYGYKFHLALPTIEHLRLFADAFRHTEFRTGDFEVTTRDAVADDVVYFDPPYTVAHKNNGFVKYNAKIFSWSDQMRLAAYAKILRSRGCGVVVSNADHPSINELYVGFKSSSIERASVIAASSSKRLLVTERVFYC
jgi:DNA adenine methylase